MVGTNLTHDQEMHVESHAPYVRVFLVLAVLTAIEYFYARIFKDSAATLVMGLMFWAVVKAGLVGWYFMHLKFEGRWVYYMLVPAGMLATVFVFALMPDIGLQPGAADVSGAEDEDAVAVAAPLSPGPPSDNDDNNVK